MDFNGIDFFFFFTTNPKKYFFRQTVFCGTLKNDVKYNSNEVEKVNNYNGLK